MRIKIGKRICGCVQFIVCNISQLFRTQGTIQILLQFILIHGLFPNKDNVLLKNYPLFVIRVYVYVPSKIPGVII